MSRPDETSEYWLPFPHDDLALRCAVLHQQRRELEEAKYAAEVHGARQAIAGIFVKGKGVEVGAGARPFPIPRGTECFHGDVLDAASLAKYFGTDRVALDGAIDAQTMRGVPEASLDFAISAHVIEHLHDPIGSIRATIATLKPGGVFILVAPELTQTWDKRRPPTTLEHVIQDSRDGGASTRYQAAEEHCRYVYPELTGKEFTEQEIRETATRLAFEGADLHIHAWRAVDFAKMLEYVAKDSPFRIEAALSYVNENAFVLRRQ